VCIVCVLCVYCEGVLCTPWNIGLFDLFLELFDLFLECTNSAESIVRLLCK